MNIPTVATLMLSLGVLLSASDASAQVGAAGAADASSQSVVAPRAGQARAEGSAPTNLIEVALAQGRTLESERRAAAASGGSPLGELAQRTTPGRDASLQILGTIFAGQSTNWLPGLLPAGVYRFVYPRSGSFERYLLYVPDVAPGTPRPLMVGFHSFSATEVEILNKTSFFEEAKERDWYLLTPLGRHDWIVSQETFSSPESQASVAEDLRRVLADFEIDTDRIYGFGFSIGGGAVANYAARFLDPDPARGMFAAIANHTGSVSTAHTYYNEPDDTHDPPYDTPDYLAYVFGGDPGFVPFRYQQASTIDLDDVTELVDPDTSLAWNLRHVPIQVWYRTTDPLQYLIEQTLAFSDFVTNVVGGSVTVRAIDQGPSTHTWFTMRETGVCDYFATKSLTLPKLAKTLADRDATFFYFDVEQAAAGAMTPFSWWIDGLGNDVHVLDARNLSRITVDLLGAGLTPLAPYSVPVKALDSSPFDVVLKGIPAAPYQVYLDGALVPEVICGALGGWCYDAGEGTLSLPASELPGDAGTHLWEVFPLPPDAIASTAQASPGSVVANGVAASTVSLTIRDAGGHVLPRQAVSISASGGGNILAQPGPTDSAGQTSGTIASTVAETKTLTVTVEPLGLNLELLAAPSVTFVGDADQISPTLSEAVVSPSSGVVANGVAETELSVTLRDINGNPVSGIDLGVQVSGSDNTLTPPAGPTDAQGQAFAQLASTRAEQKTLTIIADPLGAAVILSQQPLVEFVADPSTISVTLSSVIASPELALVADGLASSIVTVTVVDAFSNPVAGQQVLLAASGADNFLQQPAGPTDAAGQVQGSLASTHAEQKLVTVTVDPNGSPLVLAATPAVEFIGDADQISASLSTTQATPSSGVLANGVEPSVLTITLLDVNGNLVPGVDVDVLVSGSDNFLTPPANPTDAQGQTSAQLASTRAEQKTLTIIADPLGAALNLIQQPLVEFVADSSTISATLSSVLASPQLALVADGVASSIVTVTVVDAYSNPVAGQAVGLAASGSNNFLQQPAGLTDAAGQAQGSLASTRAESKLVTVTVDPTGSSLVLATTPAVEFVGDPSAIDADLSTISASPAFGALADGLDAIVIEVGVRDQNDNPVEGQVVALTVSGHDSNLTQPSASDAGGLALGSLSSSAAEWKTIAAVVNPGQGEVALSTSATARFVWGLADTFYVRSSGSDLADGTSPARAWASLTHAATQLGAGDTLYVGAGSYFETPTFGAAGSLSAPIRVLADRSGARTGDAGLVLIDGGGAAATLTLDGASFFELRGFTLIGASPALGAPGGGVHVGATLPTSSVLLSELEIHDCGRGIHLADAAGAVVEDCRISNQAGGAAQGVLVDATLGASLRDLLIYNNAGEGLRVQGGATGITLSASTLYANAGDQVVIDGAGSSADLSDNIIVAGLADGIEVAGGAGVTADFNTVWGQAGNDYVGLSAGANDLSLDPLLVDPDGLDLLLGGAEAADDRFELDPSSTSADSGSSDASSVLRQTGLTLADRRTRVDLALDGTGADLSTVNRGYHYDAPRDALDALTLGDARLVHAESGRRATRALSFQGGTQSWSSALRLPPSAPGLRWLEAVSSGLDAEEDFVFGLGEAAGATQSSLLEWDGSEWRRAWAGPVLAAAQADRRGFDLALTADGSVLAVYTDGGPTPLYRVRKSGRWSAPSALPLNDAGGPFPDLNSAPVQWVELEAQPGDDAVALAYVDAADDLVALVWDGTQWDGASASALEVQVSLASATGEVDQRAFDLAWEASSGDLLVAWAREAAAGVWYSTLPSGSSSWSAASQLTAIAPAAAPHFVDLASELAGDRIALSAATLEGVEALGLALWDGVAMIDAVEIDAQSRDWNGSCAGGFPAAVAWLGASGQFVCVYADSDSAVVNWAQWDSGSGWSLQADLPFAAMGLGQDVRLAPLGAGGALLLQSDSSGALFAARHDGSSWSLTNAGAALASNLPIAGGLPFVVSSR